MKRVVWSAVRAVARVEVTTCCRAATRQVSVFVRVEAAKSGLVIFAETSQVDEDLNHGACPVELKNMNIIIKVLGMNFGIERL